MKNIFHIVIMLLFFAYFIIMVLASFPTSDFQVEKGVELAIDKHVPSYVIKPSVILQKNIPAGKLNTSAIIYPVSIQNKYYTFGWIWKKSISIDSITQIITLNQQENIRVASNRTIIGQLYPKAIGELIHESSRKSWVLGRFDFEIDSLKISNNYPKGLFSGIHPVMTITSTDGGEYYDENAPESEMLIGMYLFIKRNLRTIMILLFGSLLILLILRFRSRLKNIFRKIASKIKNNKDESNTTANKVQDGNTP